MRISVQHTETFTYATPSQGTIQVLRLTPRDFTGHYVCDWSIDVDADCKMETTKDAFGNILTSFSLPGPLESLTISASGEVETEETHGIVRGTAEKVPEGVFMRPSHSEHQAALVRTLLNAGGEASGPPLDHMHTLMGAMHAAMASNEGGKAAQQGGQQQTQEAGGSNQLQQDAGASKDAGSANPGIMRLRTLIAERPDLTEADLVTVFCDASRRLGMPARLVSGYRLLDGASATKDDRDVWAEIRIDELGWVGFDPLHKSCPCEESVRVAIGVDLDSIRTARIAHYGGATDVDRQTSIAVRRIDG